MRRTVTQLMTFFPILAATLLCGAPTRCFADYCYAWTELSWEWLTDASRAIVVGQITAVHEPRFELKVERLLKRRDLEIKVGDIVTGPVLGRSRVDNLQVTDCLLPEIGWPSLLDPTTYPAKSEIRDRPWRPNFYREKSWACGDRCLIFFGHDLQCLLQVINLDRAVTIEVEFLSVDMVGQVVTRAEDLLERIASRLNATVDGLGQPRVCSAAIVRGDDSPINGQDYYHFLAPADAKLFPNSGNVELPPRPKTVSIREQNGSPESFIDEPVITQATAYWFLSGRTTKEFAVDAAAERDSAVAEMLRGYEEQCHRRGRLIADENVSPQVKSGFRLHRTNYRTYPLGWLCVLADDRKHIAFLGSDTMQVYAVDDSLKRADRLVMTRRDVHRTRSCIEFSRDGRLLAYATDDGSVCMFDLHAGQPLWTAKASAPEATKPTSTHKLVFSHDHRYLVQESRRGTDRYPDSTGGRSEAIHIWDVRQGRIALTPFKQWRQGVRYICFHPTDSAHVRLYDPQAPEGHGIWSVPQAKLVATVESRDDRPVEGAARGEQGNAADSQ